MQSSRAAFYCFSLLSFSLCGATDLPKELHTQATINGKVEVHALLIPPKDVKHIFGRAIAERFAVIQTTVVNPSGDYNLLIENISTDYSQWLLAGCIKEEPKKHTGSDSNSMGHDPLATQAVTRSCQVSSLELRAIRQVALQGQVESTRNRWDRGLKTLATIGTGLTAAGGLGPILPKAVDAFSGSAIPAFEYFFPDNTIAQVNLLNDLAYAANSLVPKDSSKVFMTFFPIDRFLGDYLGRYYRTSPALFYAPLQYYLDPKFDDFFVHLEARLQQFGTYSANIVKDLNGLNVKFDSEKDKATVTPANVLSYLTLNSLRVLVNGKFVVDTTEVTPSISKISIGASQAKAFAGEGSVSGSLTGQFLAGAKLVVADADALGITVTRTDAGTEDTSLEFNLALTKSVPYQTKLSFTVEKAGKSGNLTSAAGTYVVQELGKDDYPVLSDLQPPSVVAGGAVTLTGSHFWNLSADDHVKVVLTNSASGSKPIVLSLDPDNISATTIKFNFPDGRGDLPPGSYAVAVSYKSPVDGTIVSETRNLTVTAKP